MFLTKSLSFNLSVAEVTRMSPCLLTFNQFLPGLKSLLLHFLTSVCVYVYCVYNLVDKQQETVRIMSLHKNARMKMYSQ